jgi:hypothetical protein
MNLKTAIEATAKSTKIAKAEGLEIAELFVLSTAAGRGLPALPCPGTQ